MEVLDFSGPINVTIRLSESDDGWSFGLDTRTTNGCGIGSPVSASRVHLTRASAVDAAVRWVRAGHGREIGRELGAWLDGLATNQQHFGEAA